jgi:hypothetical protein
VRALLTALARTRLPLCAVLSLVCLAGCRLFADGVACETDGNCPLGFACRANLCVVPRADAGAPDGGPRQDGGVGDAGHTDAGDGGEPVDAGAAEDAGAPLDAGAPDGDPDAPLVLYTFDEGGGDVVLDTSGRGVPLDLSIEDADAVSWNPGSLDVTGDALIRSGAAATKVIDPCVASGELTVEAWVVPDRDDLAGPARVVTLSTNTGSRNWTLGADDTDWVFRLRNENAVAQNQDYLDLFANDGIVPGERRHVLFTYDDDGDGYQLYLDGSLSGSRASEGALAPWGSAHELALANELTRGRSWTGRFLQVAIWCRALPPATVAARHARGPLPTP